MWTFTSLQSTEFLFIFGLSTLCAFFWVSYSLQEMLILSRKNTKNRIKRHIKELENYRQELKKRN